MEHVLQLYKKDKNKCLGKHFEVTKDREPYKSIDTGRDDKLITLPGSDNTDN